jgi:hypothetical protein
MFLDPKLRKVARFRRSLSNFGENLLGEVPRMILIRTSVRKGKKEGRGYDARPSKRFHSGAEFTHHRLLCAHSLRQTLDPLHRRSHTLQSASR